ncbi:threonine dehydrogenase-like Zn-dependent dehydrogenase [Bradyrhizobium sp. USDA 3686]|uniref:alcohol dehydrogenase catalytic domain-containing protein n=1 Tax=Bradyrhizobium canariense TaxID=255045 RepID=UPI00195DF93F|nr:alcohol dehydrogenase catalytic domain-containing protein [Bradyrhizobium canariense]MBM7486789.1 alcohol dehydrogenase [Bradyrhizobium canariense]
MKQLTFVRPEKVEWREVADPRVEGALEAIVAPLVIGRCDLDVGYVRGFIPLQGGEAIGHEMIGRVLDVGSDVLSVKPGDIVVVPAQISCGWCANCRRGFTGRCLSVPLGSSYGMGRKGSFGCSASDLVKVPFADGMLFPLPPGAVPADWIGFADMALDSWRAVGAPLSQRPGASVLIIGGWPSVIAIYAAGLASSLGAGCTDYWDDDPVRLTEAAKFGAHTITRGVAEPERTYEIVVDCRNDAASPAEAIRFVEPEGVITCVTYHAGQTSVPLLDAYYKGVTWRIGRPNVRAQMDALCPICVKGLFHPEHVKTSFFSYEEAPEAWMSHDLRVAAVQKP